LNGATNCGKIDDNNRGHGTAPKPTSGRNAAPMDTGKLERGIRIRDVVARGVGVLHRAAAARRERAKP
jgi:hypothetical protein